MTLDRVEQHAVTRMVTNECLLEEEKKNTGSK